MIDSILLEVMVKSTGWVLRAVFGELIKAPLLLGNKRYEQEPDQGDVLQWLGVLVHLLGCPAALSVDLLRRSLVLLDLVIESGQLLLVHCI